MLGPEKPAVKHCQLCFLGIWTHFSIKQVVDQPKLQKSKTCEKNICTTEPGLALAKHIKCPCSLIQMRIHVENMHSLSRGEGTWNKKRQDLSYILNWFQPNEPIIELPLGFINCMFSFLCKYKITKEKKIQTPSLFRKVHLRLPSFPQCAQLFPADQRPQCEIGCSCSPSTIPDRSGSLCQRAVLDL